MNKIKRFLSIVLSALMVLSMTAAFAVSVSFAAVDGDFSYTVKDEKATVSAYNGSGTAVVVPAALGGYTVVGVGADAFRGMAGITSVSLPAGVTVIGEAAFADCAALTVIDLPAALTKIGDAAFMNTALTDLTIPASAEYIGKGSLSGCTSLATLTVPFVGVEKTKSNFLGALFDAAGATDTANYPASLKTVTVTDDTTVDAYAFYNMKKVENIIWNGTPTALGAYAFYGCSALTDLALSFTGIATVSKYAFAGCAALTEMPLSSRVTTIGEGAFKNCSALADITVYSGLKAVGADVVAGTAWLAAQADGPVFLAKVFITYKGTLNGALTIPSTATAIAAKALANRGDITSLVIPNSVRYIADNMLTGNTGVSSITLPFIGESPDTADTAFIGYLYGAQSERSNGTAVNKALKSVILTDVTTVMSDAFNGCQYITSVTIPETVTGIGSTAFANCAALTTIYYNAVDATVAIDAFSGCGKISTVDFGDNVEVIPTYLCTSNYALKKIEIPAAVRRIEARAFAGCYNATELTFDAVNCTSIAADAFNYCHKLSTVALGENVKHIPAGLFTDYGGSSITEITIPEGITSIDAGAFSKCTSLKTVHYNAPSCAIGMDAFSGCSSLQTVTFGEGVTTVPANLFTGNGAIKSVTLPDTITAIDSFAFADCSALLTINVPDTLASVAAGSLSGSKWYELQENGEVYLGKVFYEYKGASAGGSVTLRDDTYAIADSAFAGKALAKIFVPTSVHAIGADAFKNTGATIECYASALDVITYANANGLPLNILTCDDDDTYYVITRPATAEADGERQVVCAKCGQILVTESYAYADTMEGEWIQTKAPTCKEAGERTRTAGFISETQEIPAIAHKAGEWRQIIDPTCTAPGKKQVVCTMCGEVLDSKDIPMVDHTPGRWTVVKEPRTYATGLRAIPCTECGAYLQTASIDKIPLSEDSNVFVDVSSTDWFYDTVYFVYDNGLFAGISDTEFAPTQTMDRAMFVTVLGRLHGVAPNNNVKTKFTDVGKNKWYTGYVKWASDNGIVAGTSQTTFSPTDPVTREQICVMMVNYAKFAGIELTPKQKEVFFKDNDAAGKYALNAIITCQKAGIVNGTGGGYFTPKGKASRAEVAQILKNFALNFLAN